MSNRSALPDISKPKRADHAGYHPNYKMRRKFAAAALTTVVLLGGTYGKHVYDGIEANNKQPSCDVKAKSGDSINLIVDRISLKGDDVREESSKVFDGITGDQRTPSNTPSYYVGGDHGVMTGDTIRIGHVEPDVCKAVGGTPVAAHVKVVPQNHS
ncbi:MAG: hypothetical protein ABI354_00135 [Candidatus Saccharimonadales bacterium]